MTNSIHWRAMTIGDVPKVIDLAAAIHTDYPEADEIFMERQAIYPAGCLVLTIGGQVSGYMLSHPWTFGAPPALDTLLIELPQAPSTFYLHDLALLPVARGTGAARRAVEIAVDTSRNADLKNISLVAVGGSNLFWGKMGFKEPEDHCQASIVKSYGENSAYMVRHL